ncbi:MAG: hypothetical protein COW84_03120 [Gammaproteobacteria bacterium CG22_combo_CG10-13_8_21_14_all_40_8]|nr:MAG: hypothetical protein COW84_03120 [Gammaproteobacteria bacterium CG22_combo_CG10-13_8_21_14_all_40_8]
MRTLIVSCLLLSGLMQQATSQEPSESNFVILTGKIKPGDVQSFITPWSSSYRLQIKWMKPEGESVEKEDLVVLFDTANLDSEIEQEKVKLRQSKNTAQQKTLELEQKIIDAEHDLIKAKLEYQLAKLAADVPIQYRSNLEKDNIAFEYIKAQKTLERATTDLKTAQNELDSETQKQILEVKRIGETLTKKESELALLQLKAERSGTVIHAMHPWDGSKITEGQNVQTSWMVASIPGRGNESVEAWVNEVDWPKIKTGKQVSLSLDAYQDQKFTGIINHIAMQAQSKEEWGNSNYYDVSIEITQKPKVTLVPGMSVRVVVSTEMIVDTSDERKADEANVIWTQEMENQIASKGRDE